MRPCSVLAKGMGANNADIAIQQRQDIHMASSSSRWKHPDAWRLSEEDADPYVEIHTSGIMVRVWASHLIDSRKLTDFRNDSLRYAFLCDVVTGQ